MRIFITGATGFIGSHLIPLLSQHTLLLLSRKQEHSAQQNVSFVQADLSEREKWEKRLFDFAPDACIHLAWKGLPDYSLEACLENFDLSARLFESLGTLGCKKVFSAGTCWEYGAIEGLAKENHVPAGLSRFAAFKTALRIVGESLSQEKSFDLIWGRIFFVYGPGQRESSLIPTCYSSFLKGREPAVKNPRAACDFVYVCDVALAIKALIETEGLRGIFNIGSGKLTPVSSVCECVAAVLGCRGNDGINKESGDKCGFWADITALTVKTGWKPLMPLEKGIEETIRELRKTNASH
ncbi:MAG: NAD(P)-dependent oxidoreductase [Candidatus Omnitrophota bacterium]